MMNVIIAVISSGALSTLISGMFNLIASRKQKDQKLITGVRTLLYSQLKHDGQQYLTQGYVHAEDLEDFLRMHSIYHDDLEGNGFLDNLVHQVKQLPIKYVKGGDLHCST